MEEMGCCVFDEVVAGFLVVDLAVEGVDPPFIVGSSTPAGWFGAEFGNCQEEFVAKGDVEG